MIARTRNDPNTDAVLLLARFPIVPESIVALGCILRHTIGRKGCTATIADDASISRVHCEIVVEELPLDWDKSRAPRVFVKDLSKFGTRVDEVAVDKTCADGSEVSVPSRPVRGRAYSRLTLGIKTPAATALRLTQEKIVLCVTKQIYHEDGDDYAMLLQPQDLQAAARAGVHLTSVWTEDCTHLLAIRHHPRSETMCDIDLPTRLAFMLSGKPVVSVDFIRALSAGQSPDPKEYFPSVDGHYLPAGLSCKLRGGELKQRRQLLSGLTFVYRRPREQDMDKVKCQEHGLGNLWALCGAADEEICYVIRSSGGEVAHMCDDVGAVAKRGAQGDPSVFCLTDSTSTLMDDPEWSALKQVHRDNELIFWLFHTATENIDRMRSEPAAVRNKAVEAAQAPDREMRQRLSKQVIKKGRWQAGRTSPAAGDADDDEATTDGGGGAAMACDDDASGHVDQPRQRQAQPSLGPSAGGALPSDPPTAALGGEKTPSGTIPAEDPSRPVVYAEENGALDGKAVVVYEPALLVRKPLAVTGGSGRSNPIPTGRGNNVPNFKTFRKTLHSRSGGSAAGRSVGTGGRPAQRRRVVVKYADDVYDALHQWEDAATAARHEAERAQAQVAEEMFAEHVDYGTGGAVRAGGGGRGAAGRGGKGAGRGAARPRAPAKPRGSRAK